MDKHVSRFLIIYTVKEAEEAILVTRKVIVIVIQDCRDPPGNGITVEREKQLNLRMLIERVFAGGKHIFLGNEQLRYVIRIIAIQFVRKINKPGQVFAWLYRKDTFHIFTDSGSVLRKATPSFSTASSIWLNV